MNNTISYSHLRQIIKEAQLCGLMLVDIVTSENETTYEYVPIGEILGGSIVSTHSNLGSCIVHSGELVRLQTWASDIARSEMRGEADGSD